MTITGVTDYHNKRGMQFFEVEKGTIRCERYIDGANITRVIEYLNCKAS